MDIIRNLEQILNKKARVKHIDQRAGQFKGRMISSEKAKKLLGWEPQYSYRDALEKYVKGYLAEWKGSSKR